MIDPDSHPSDTATDEFDFACGACEGSGNIFSIACPLCDTSASRHAQSSRTGFDQPAEHNAQDVSVSLQHAISTGGRSARRLKRESHGDPSLHYCVEESEHPVVISRAVWDVFEFLFQASIDDNRERPFLIVFNELKQRAEVAFIGSVGDEKSCCHSDSDILGAHCAAQKLGLGEHVRVSYGHTHPVFWPDVDTCKSYPDSLVSKRAYAEHRKPRPFGCFPSCVFRGRSQWEAARDIAEPAARHVFDEVVSRRLYKKHGADFCASFIRSKAECNPPGVGPSSRWEWNISPRMRQVGCFRPLHNEGSVVYCPWVVDKK